MSLLLQSLGQAGKQTQWEQNRPGLDELSATSERKQPATTRSDLAENGFSNLHIPHMAGEKPKKTSHGFPLGRLTDPHYRQGNAQQNHFAALQSWS